MAAETTLLQVVENNLRLALVAARDGLPVIVAEQVAKVIAVPKCSHNLLYLDLAVLRRIWQRRGIDKILNALVPTEQAEVRQGWPGLRVAPQARVRYIWAC